MMPNVTFAEFFNFAASISLPVGTSQTDEEFAALVEELFSEFLPTPNGVYHYYNSDNIIDPNKPFEISFTQPIEYAVKILAVPSEIENRRYSKYMIDTAIPVGAIKVLMQPGIFVPKIKDTILYQGRTLVIGSIDKVAPLYKDLLYILILEI